MNILNDRGWSWVLTQRGKQPVSELCQCVQRGAQTVSSFFCFFVKPFSFSTQVCSAQIAPTFSLGFKLDFIHKNLGPPGAVRTRFALWPLTGSCLIVLPDGGTERAVNINCEQRLEQLLHCRGDQVLSAGLAFSFMTLSSPPPPNL